MLLSSTNAHAQRLSGTSLNPIADSIRQAALEDTAYAVQRLYFARRREQRLFAIVYGSVLTSITTRSLLDGTFKASAPNGTKVFMGLGLTVIAAFLVRRLLIIHRYSPHQEMQMLADLEAGKPLPPKIRHALKATDFGVHTSTK